VQAHSTALADELETASAPVGKRKQAAELKAASVHAEEHKQAVDVVSSEHSAELACVCKALDKAEVHSSTLAETLEAASAQAEKCKQAVGAGGQTPM